MRPLHALAGAAYHGLRMDDRGPAILTTPTPSPDGQYTGTRIAWAGLVLATISLAIIGWRGVWHIQPDFEYFYQGGRALLEHGNMDSGYDRGANGALLPRGRLDWYLPFVPRAMTLLAWLGERPAGLGWLGINLAGFVAVVWFLGRNFAPHFGARWPVAALAALVCMPLAWLWEFRLNQVDTLTLLLLVGSFVVWQKNRVAVAGFWLGLAVLFKLTPALLLVWFALKRQYRTCLTAAAVILLAGPVADRLALGQEYARACNQGWLSAAINDGSPAALVRQEREMDWRNQGVGAVLARWLTHTNWRTHFDNDPRAPSETLQAYINVADWPRATVGRVAVGLVAVMVASGFWIGRKKLVPGDLPAERVEWALVLLMMLMAMPVLRRYHMVFAFPALVVLLDALRGGLFNSGAAKFAVACVCAFATAQWSLLMLGNPGPNLFEAGGGLLLSVFLLSAPLVWLRLRPARVGAHD